MYQRLLSLFVEVAFIDDILRNPVSISRLLENTWQMLASNL